MRGHRCNTADENPLVALPADGAEESDDGGQPELLVRLLALQRHPTGTRTLALAHLPVARAQL